MSIDVECFDGFVVVTCHEYWNTDVLRDTIRDSFTKHTLKHGEKNLVLDMTEPADIKPTKGFFIPLRYIMDRARGLKKIAVLVVKDHAEHLDRIATRSNGVIERDTEVRVVDSIDKAFELVR